MIKTEKPTGFDISEQEKKMKIQFENGAIVAFGKQHEKAEYDVSNYTFGARFDGKGGVEYYSMADGTSLAFPIRFIQLSYNGKIQDGLSNKKVTMLGRTQTIELDLKTAVLKIEQFLDTKESGVFTCYTLLTENRDDVLQVGLLGNCFSHAELVNGNTVCGDGNILESDRDVEYVRENLAVYFKLDSQHPKIRTRMICCGLPKENTDFPEKFDNIHLAVKQETASVLLPEQLTETEKATYLSSYWCSLENYKEKGEYKAFMAGCKYLSPMRSYYRDSYFTVLPLYNGHIDKVKNQILTLVRGIGNDGSCPSAVKSDWTSWWGDHYDSPSFLAMMLYDYIHFCGDIAFADEKIGNDTTFGKVIKAIDHLSGYTDETGLLYKAGRYNQRDWADEVNRYGYVTYDELLYARALYSIAQIYRLKGDRKHYNLFDDRYRKVKDAINTKLWDEQKGYYINFTNEDYTEDNLSIDTVFATIFGIADEKRSRSMLTKMEQLLESKNNDVGEDFGSMCVYPLYSRIDSARNKSSQPFNYHNGANWPYLSAMYAYAKRQFGMEYRHLLTIPFEYNLKKGNYTPIEYFSPYCEDGSLLQGWSGNIAFVLDEKTSIGFWN